jgi:aminoglycoside/choline kinase family phosphotransferase
MSDRDLTPDAIAHLVGDDVETLTPLAGDASTRRYWRARLKECGSVVVMRTQEGKEIRSFVAITALMEEMGAPVPKFYSSEGNLLLLEDLGDGLLQSEIAGATEEALYDRYRPLLNTLADFQATAALRAKRGDRDCFVLAFDVEKLTFETDFTRTHFVEGFMGRSLSDAERGALDTLWAAVAGELAADPFETLCHRDFHARNIMVAPNGRVVWIDYQDARMGRFTYDLASLLEDPYAALPFGLRDRLTVDHWRLLRDRGMPVGDEESFRRIYRLSALQRLYKALGTYGYQIGVKGNETFRPSVAPAVAGFLRHADERFCVVADLIAPSS